MGIGLVLLIAWMVAGLVLLGNRTGRPVNVGRAAEFGLGAVVIGGAVTGAPELGLLRLCHG
jgi:putative N-acetylmannosamine-6-phosphate epimerase